MQKFIFSAMVLSLFFLSGCEDGEGIDKASVKQALNERKIVRLTESEIQQIANNLGHEISDALMTASAEDSLRLLSSLDGVKVKLVKPFYSSKVAALNESEKQILEAYEYCLQNNMPVNSNLQKLENAGFLYTTPFKKNSLSDDTVGFLFIEMEKSAVVKKGYLR